MYVYKNMNMKKISLIISALALLMLGINACSNKDSADKRDAFVGYYSISDSVIDETTNIAYYGTTYNLEIKKDPADENGLILIGIDSRPEEVKAGISATGFVVSSQDFYAGYPINGSGSINGSKLSLNYFHYMYSHRTGGTKI